MEEDIPLQEEEENLNSFQVSGPLQGASTSQSVFDINDPKVLIISDNFLAFTKHDLILETGSYAASES